ncbi:hypothetical protein GLYMA_19G240900v4 [Glycine max]|uniref:Uncharacterized protein n=2 Tax=Glycine subgen. Soja TaxID=1462606 RepID=K7N015_SOYBN|nr:hypothetical protein JHK86_054412 [Glycine max]KAG4916911.1 hypothetical protein JHK87_054468 [Glycine soja]KAG4928882.1 hypothetical protein JHK85_055368 [Glycine max]KAG5084391.1 hypothetical protein JHK84_054429 [Glycine max]KAH1079335.1 hypothetical protein GYH30_054073 [Glycine max]
MASSRVYHFLFFLSCFASAIDSVAKGWVWFDVGGSKSSDDKVVMRKRFWHWRGGRWRSFYDFEIE